MFLIPQGIEEEFASESSEDSIHSLPVNPRACSKQDEEIPMLEASSAPSEGEQSFSGKEYVYGSPYVKKRVTFHIPPSNPPDQDVANRKPVESSPIPSRSSARITESLRKLRDQLTLDIKAAENRYHRLVLAARVHEEGLHADTCIGCEMSDSDRLDCDLLRERVESASFVCCELRVRLAEVEEKILDPKSIDTG